MQTHDINIEEQDRISTELLNRLNRDVYTDISALFDMAFEILGRSELLNIAIRLMDVSNKKVIDTKLKQQDDAYSGQSFLINSSSDIIYPTSAPAVNQATIMTSHQIILNHIVHRKRILTDLTDSGRIIRAGVKLAKSSHNYIFLAEPERVYESNITDILTGEHPYLIRFVGEDIGEAQLILEITCENETYSFNTVEYTPFPIAGLMEVDNITIQDNPIENKTGVVIYNETNKFERSQISYIPFLPVQGNRLNLSILNTTRIESMNGCTAGVGLIEAFETTYSDTSYFGYGFAPTSDVKLRSISITGNWSCPYAGGVTIRVYDSKSEFDSMSNDYMVSIDSVVRGTINLQKDKVYYLLFIMQIEDNHPQCIESIGVTLEQ
ncbi:MAG: hypothetical protein DRI61_09695 [Chloroflexi bacterium]|nr:MAG: hypothetical protein DRI61_09695 [Chloroflexota bacterium]